MIRHLLCVDMDCFFVSVERALNPYLNNHILIVAHHNSRSVVTSCCYKARQYGVRAGMSLEKAKKKCPRAKIIEPNLNEYTNYSRKVYTFLKTVSPELEKGSIDEFYIDLTGCERLYGSITKIAELIKLEIKNKIQLPCSIGIGTNKMIAKIASNLAKPEGIVSVEKGGEKLFLEPLPINIIPGVGNTTRELLNERGIWTIKQLAKIPKSYLKLLLGQQGENLHYSSLGVGDQKCRNDSLGKKSNISFASLSLPSLIKILSKISFS